MVQSPTSTGVTSPFSTLATAGFEEVQVTSLKVLLEEPASVAFSCTGFWVTSNFNWV